MTGLALAVAVLALIGTFAVTIFMNSALADLISSEIDLTNDRSMAEIVNYGLAFTASVLFLLASIANRSRALLFLALLMGFIWFDDSASYHERMGEYLVLRWDLPALPSLRQLDSGELIAWGAAALILGPALLFSLFRLRPGDLGALLLVAIAFCFLFLCGIVADMVHQMLFPRFNRLIGIIEDGGEMVAVTGITALAIGLSQTGRVYYEKAAAIRSVRSVSRSCG